MVIDFVIVYGKVGYFILSSTFQDQDLLDRVADDLVCWASALESWLKQIRTRSICKWKTRLLA